MATIAGKTGVFNMLLESLRRVLYHFFFLRARCLRNPQLSLQQAAFKRGERDNMKRKRFLFLGKRRKLRSPPLGILKKVSLFLSLFKKQFIRKRCIVWETKMLFSPVCFLTISWCGRVIFPRGLRQSGGKKKFLLFRRKVRKRQKEE